MRNFEKVVRSNCVSCRQVPPARTSQRWERPVARKEWFGMPTAFSSVGSSVQSLPLIPQSSEAKECSDTPGVETAKSVEPVQLSAPNLDATQSPAQLFHRIAEVREQQGLSLRTVARRTGIDVKELRRQEDPATDLKMSELLVWQKALEIPLVDLLEDDSQTLSRPVKERAKMVRIMKTAVTLTEVCQSNTRLSRLTTMLRDQLLDLMPELAEIGGWPQCGSRRGADVMGRIFHEPITVHSESLD